MPKVSGRVSKAVKANHPDLNTGDPDAQSRFAQIARADPELRAIYDRMLEFEGQQCHPQSKLVAIVNTAHSIVADAIAGFILAFALAGGGYKLVTYLPKRSDLVTAREPVTVAVVPPLAPVDAAGHLKAIRLPKSAQKREQLGTPLQTRYAHVLTGRRRRSHERQ
ncbi:MAG TPA: hypothetical protein VGJ20_31730 [Xanthobacteraceae bacterium]|jgi:curved DNA-binding protein CbpA